MVPAITIPVMASVDVAEWRNGLRILSCRLPFATMPSCPKRSPIAAGIVQSANLVLSPTMHHLPAPWIDLRTAARSWAANGVRCRLPSACARSSNISASASSPSA